MNTPLTASVVLSTKNRKDDLRRALASAVKQVPPVEIIVMDDGSSDGTSAMLAEEFPQVIVHRSELSRGYIVQRNLGAKRASGDVIFSIDDDAEYSTDKVVAQTLREFCDPRIAAVAIPYIDMNSRKLIRLPAPDSNRVYVADSFVGTAYAIRKTVFLALGGFREVLFHQSEERDLSLRLMNHGYVIRVGGSDIIHHYESPIRNWPRMTIYTARNHILYVWHNTPFPLIAGYLPATTLSLVRWGIRGRKIRWTLRGIAMGYGALIKEFFRRQPVSRSVFAIHRRITQSGWSAAWPMEQVTSRLPAPWLPKQSEKN